MTLQQLEYVVALDNYRHFVTAAQKCFVTQPTLTMQVKKLEEEIGMKIFNRKKQPLKPTSGGEQFVFKARQILREVSQLKEMVIEEKATVEGTFRVGVIPTIAPYLLPLILPTYTKDNPRSILIIEELQSAQIIERLKSNVLDIGILATPLEEKELREVPLFYEPFLFYSRHDDPLLSKETVAARDISSEKTLLLEEGHCFRNQALKICQGSTKTSSRGFQYQSGSIEALKNMVDRGLGYTLVPELSLRKSELTHARRFSQPEPVREVSLVVHNSFTKELLLDKLRRSALNNIPKGLKKNEKFIRVKWR